MQSMNSLHIGQPEAAETERLAFVSGKTQTRNNKWLLAPHVSTSHVGQKYGQQQGDEDGKKYFCLSYYCNSLYFITS